MSKRKRVYVISEYKETDICFVQLTFDIAIFDYEDKKESLDPEIEKKNRIFMKTNGFKVFLVGSSLTRIVLTLTVVQ